MMGDTSTILNCNLQRYLKSSLFIKHFVIFLSIYVFTFLLNWYALESLIVDGYMDSCQNNNGNNDMNNGNNDMNNGNNGNNGNNNSKNINKFKQQSLLNYLIYTIFIYIIFILSTKNEGPTLAIFLVGCLVLTGLQVYMKTLNSDVSKSVSTLLWINSKKKNELKAKHNDNLVDFDKIVLLHNINITLFAIMIAILLIGLYLYYTKQYKDHSHHWNWIKFFFGVNKCSGV